MNAIVMPESAAPRVATEALYEVVNGVHVELPNMAIYSILVASVLQIFLGAFVRTHRLGRVAVEGLFILDPMIDLRRRPDVAFVSAARWPFDKPIPAGDWAVVPDLAVEVTSPKDVHKEVIAKLDEYFSYGVKQVWLIEPDFRRVFIYDSPTQVRILTDADTLDSTVVPGFTLKLCELFDEFMRP
jgi:Uma2 family endonuclease